MRVGCVETVGPSQNRRPTEMSDVCFLLEETEFQMGKPLAHIYIHSFIHSVQKDSLYGARKKIKPC